MDGNKTSKNYLNKSFICFIAVLTANFAFFNLSISEAWTQNINEKKSR